jgi:Domain of unknown function (DUF5664)
MPADNPKDVIGSKKLPVHLWPNVATAYGAVGMAEGAMKYGRNNYVVTPVRAHIYVAAAMRHLMAWMEGEEYTAEGGPHLGNALATIAIILKARQNGTLIDDREFLTDPDDNAYGREVDLLMNRMRVLEERVKVDKEPRHWDRRDAKDFTASKAHVAEEKVILLDGTYVNLPPEAVVKEASMRSVVLVYSGPAPADGAVTACDSTESSLARAGWRFEHVMLRRALMARNPTLANHFVFNKLQASEVKVQLLDKR